MTKEEYEKNQENMTPWECDNGHVYMAFKNSCVFCDHCDVFWDYSNGPHTVLCTLCWDVDDGMSGKCAMFKTLEQEVSDNG